MCAFNVSIAIKDFIRIVNTRKCFIIATHRNADPDAVASMVAVKELLETYKSSNRQIQMYIPESISSVAKRILKELELDLEGVSSLSKADKNCVLVLVDTSSSYQAGEVSRFLLENRGLPLVLIDHHETGDLREKASVSIIDMNASSASELVSKIFENLGKCPSRRISTLLLTGILYDSRRFLIVGSETFKQAHYLTQICNADYQQGLKLLQQPRPDFSERVARLKGLQRMELYRLDDDIIIALTNVGAFESSVARLVIDVGADIAFVVSGDKKKARVSARAREEALQRLGLSLASFLSSLAKSIGPEESGGGHALAASATVTLSREKLLEILKTKIREYALINGMKIEVL